MTYQEEFYLPWVKILHEKIYRWLSFKHKSEMCIWRHENIQQNVKSYEDPIILG